MRDQEAVGPAGGRHTDKRRTQDMAALEAAAREYLGVPEEDQVPPPRSPKFDFPVGMTENGELRDDSTPSPGNEF